MNEHTLDIVRQAIPDEVLEWFHAFAVDKRRGSIVVHFSDGLIRKLHAEQVVTIK